MAHRVLHFIGKGQITIPQEWRAVLGMEGNVKASLEGEKIIIEPLHLEEHHWKKEIVSINELPVADRKTVAEGRKAYAKGEKGKFVNASQFFKK